MSTGATFAGPTRRRLCALCALCLLCALRVFALPPARAMYIDALEPSENWLFAGEWERWRLRAEELAEGL